MKYLYSPLSLVYLFAVLVVFTVYPSFAALAQDENRVFNDTLEILSIGIKTESESNGIQGMTVNLQYSILPDTGRTEMPSRIHATIDVLDAQNRGVQALTSVYRSKLNQLQQIVKLSNSRYEASVFFPYYTIQLPEGRHNLNVKISEISIRDTTAEDNRRVIPCKGVCKQGFTVKKPPTEKFRVVIRGIRVAKKDFKGREWDFGTSTLPDIQCRIELATKDKTDVMYYTPAMKNSFSAAWLDFSPEIIITKGDVITISVYDSDTIFDDFIGKSTFTLQELLAASKNNSELAFGKITYFILDAKKVN